MTEENTNDVRLEAPVTETTVEAPKKDFDGLSNREALEKSIQIHKEGKDPAEVVPNKTDVARAIDADIEAPAGFNKGEVEAWNRKDITSIQKAYRRIHDARTVELTRAQTAERKAERQAQEQIERERATLKPAKEMAEKVRNYLSVRGEENLPDEVKIAQALQLIEQMRSGDARAVKAELKKAGIDLDNESGQPAPAQLDQTNPEIKELLAFREEYKTEKERHRFNETAQTFDVIFKNLTSQKTRTGESVFPGLLDHSDAGIEFARELGSLTSDPGFRNLVRRRFPDADLEVITREAYIQLGGKVSGEPARVSPQQNQQHLQKSRRAAAATPGRNAPRVNDANLSGKLTNRAALEKAIELHKEH